MSKAEETFIGCYLLRSKHPRAQWRTYIGFTVNPMRRIRQHNGELTQGAWRTKRWRPWEMVVVVYGFADQRTALQFEWTWQHAETSLDVKDAVRAMRGMVRKRGADMLKGVSGQILTLFAMLSTSPWKYFPLKIRFLSGEVWRMVGDVLHVVAHHGNDCLCLPEHIRVRVGPLQDMDCGQNDLHAEHGNDTCNKDDDEEEGLSCLQEDGVLTQDAAVQGLSESPTKKSRKNMRIRCIICEELAQRTWSECPGCAGRSHVGCLAEHFLHSMPPLNCCEELDFIGSIPRQHNCLPSSGSCPRCFHSSKWQDILATLKTAGWRRGTDENSSPQKNGKEPTHQASPSKTTCSTLEDRLSSLIVNDDASSGLDQPLAFRMIRRLRDEGREACFDVKHDEPDDGCEDMMVSPVPPAVSRVGTSAEVDVIDLCSPDQGGDKDVVDLIHSPQS